MTPSTRFFCMDKDDLVWQRFEEGVDEWEKSTRTNETYRAVGKLILRYKDGEPEVMHLAIRGGYNIVYRLEYQDGSSVVMRVPIKGIVEFPEEKVRYEAATMKHVAANTTVPVPHVYHYGTAAENPTGLGPFIIMDYIDHHQSMSGALLDPGRPIDSRPVLDPDVSEEKLVALYGQMANILLQLSTLSFPRIGSLVEGKDRDGASVQGRPLISNMNDIVLHTDAPPGILPSQTYTSTHEWFSALADMHMAQLIFQHNDAVEDEDEARDKYVARQLFRNLAATGCLSTEPSGVEGDFRLFSEDFRPTNILLDKDLQIVGVIDWEFTYAAPAQFSFDPPWWLLLQGPDAWDGGYQEWAEAYQPRLKTFLRVLEMEERKMADNDLRNKVNELSLTDSRGKDIPLSRRMRESWEKQTWMVNYAARKSWAFDFMWWKFLDGRYHGPNENEDCRSRLQLLSEPQRAAMETFVARKMEESRTREIVEWAVEDAADRLAEVLV